jgi:hypothetical protein
VGLELYRWKNRGCEETKLDPDSPAPRPALPNPLALGETTRCRAIPPKGGRGEVSAPSGRAAGSFESPAPCHDKTILLPYSQTSPPEAKPSPFPPRECRHPRREPKEGHRKGTREARDGRRSGIPTLSKERERASSRQLEANYDFCSEKEQRDQCTPTGGRLERQISQGSISLLPPPQPKPRNHRLLPILRRSIRYSWPGCS